MNEVAEMTPGVFAAMGPGKPDPIAQISGPRGRTSCCEKPDGSAWSSGWVRKYAVSLAGLLRGLGDGLCHAPGPRKPD